MSYADGRPWAASEVSIGTILSRGFDIWQRNIVAFTLIVMICQLPTTINSLLAVRTLPGQSPTVHDPHALAHAFGQGFWLSFVAMMVLFQVAQAAITLKVVGDETMQPHTLPDLLLRSLGRVVPLIVTLLCQELAAGLATLCLIVPGLIFIIASLFSAQCCIAEGLGPIESIKRSMYLTKGYRWRVLGYVLLMTIPLALMNLLQFWVTRNEGVIAGAIVRLIGTSLTTGFLSTAAAVFYITLCNGKGGLGGRLASVFD